MERGSGAEIHQAGNCQTLRELIPQDIYQPPRQKKKFKEFRVIEFSVRGEKGLLLSDALEGKWDGFDGRDDKPFSCDDGAQIMLRLRVRFRADLSSLDHNG